MSDTNPEDFCDPSNLTIMENWHCRSQSKEEYGKWKRLVNSFLELFPRFDPKYLNSIEC